MFLTYLTKSLAMATAAILALIITYTCFVVVVLIVEAIIKPIVAKKKELRDGE